MFSWEFASEKATHWNPPLLLFFQERAELETVSLSVDPIHASSRKSLRIRMNYELGQTVGRRHILSTNFKPFKTVTSVQ